MSIPGVPSVPASVNLFAQIALVIADAVSFLTSFGASQWGIFQDGVALVEADSVVSLGYKQDWAIATYAIEKGGFQSYNKVDTPYSARVRFASGGSQANRQALLDSIAAIAGTTELYDIVTPEAVFTNANIQQYSYQRSSQNGVGLIQVDIQLIEVRVNATSEFTSVQSPSAEGRVNDGVVQPVDASGSSDSAVRSNVEIRPVTE